MEGKAICTTRKMPGVRCWTLAESEKAAREFLALPRLGTAVRGLMKELLSEDLLERRAVANVARLISARRPGLLAGYVDLLAELAVETPQEEWPARCYLLLAAVHNAATPSQRRRLLALARAMGEEERIAVRANAIEAIGLLALADAELRDDLVSWLSGYRFDSIPAIRCRAKRMGRLLERASGGKPF